MESHEKAARRNASPCGFSFCSGITPSIDNFRFSYIIPIMYRTIYFIARLSKNCAPLQIRRNLPFARASNPHTHGACAAQNRQQPQALHTPDAQTQCRPNRRSVLRFPHSFGSRRSFARRLLRVYLKTHDVTGSEGFLRCARHFFAGILTYFKEK